MPREPVGTPQRAAKTGRAIEFPHGLVRQLPSDARRQQPDGDDGEHEAEARHTKQAWAAERNSPERHRTGGASRVRYPTAGPPGGRVDTASAIADNGELPD
jgi:hypothetical protein